MIKSFSKFDSLVLLHKTHRYSGIDIFCKLLKILQFFTIVSNTQDVVHKKAIHCSPKTELLSLFVISLVLSLNFSINDTRSLGPVAKSNSTSLLKHDCISASLCSSVSIPITHSILTNLPKNLLNPSFWRINVFPHAVVPTTNIFPQNRPS